MEVQTLLAISLGGLMLQHPRMSRVMDTAGWMVNHPLWSIAIALLSIAVLWSIIKVITRGIEAISMAILQTPLRLIWEAIKFIFKWLRKSLLWGWNKFRNQSENIVLEDTAVADAEESRQLQIQARLAEISQRLGQIQQEQAELLQEAAVLIESNNSDVPSLERVNGKVENPLLQPSKASINN